MRKRGRPSLFRKKYVEQAEKLSKLGATDVQIADFFKVSIRTVCKWAVEREEFSQALKVGKYPADDKTERSLFQRANGYTFEAEEIHIIEGKVVRVKVMKHVPPDVTACIFWLKNRRPNEWRERQEQKLDVHMSLSELVALSFREDLPKLPPPKHLLAQKGNGTENKS